MHTRHLAVLVVMAAAVPTGASANFQFSCGSCTTVGGAPAVIGAFLGPSTVTGSPAGGEFWAWATGIEAPGGTTSLAAEAGYDPGLIAARSLLAGVQGDIGLADTGARRTEIPEPASMFLLGSGLLGLAGVARRRRRQQP